MSWRGVIDRVLARVFGEIVVEPFRIEPGELERDLRFGRA